MLYTLCLTPPNLSFDGSVGGMHRGLIIYVEGVARDNVTLSQ